MKIKVSKRVVWILAFVILAFVLRTIIAMHLNFGADEAVYATRGINIISANRLSTIDQSPVYFYVLDVGYKIFGVNAFSARLPGILFGALAVVLVFLIGKEFFDSKKAMIAGALFAISGYSIRHITELDMMMTFFILFSVYFFIKGIKYDESKYVYSALFLGIAVLIKPISLLIIPGYFIYYFIYFKKLCINKKMFKTILASALLFLVLLSPILVYNYLLYKDKGISDLFFVQYLNIENEEFHGLGLEEGWTSEKFFKIVPGVFKRFFNFDFLIFGLALLGAYFSFKKKRKLGWLFLFSILLPLLFLMGTSGSPTHYVMFFPFFCLFAAEGVEYIDMKVGKKKVLIGILIFIMLVNIFLLKNNMLNGNATLELRSFVVDNIPKNALVLVDDRTYTGLNAWALNDKHYLTVNHFKSIINQEYQIEGAIVSMSVYFVECADDDCAWGGLKENAEMQKRSEEFVDFFKNGSIKLVDITDDWREGKPLYYTIYKKEMMLKQAIPFIADTTHEFYYYPVRWKTEKEIFDDYDVNGFFDGVLNIIAYVVLYLSVLIAIGSLGYVVWILKK